MHSASSHKVAMTAPSDNAEEEFRRMAEEEVDEAVRLENLICLHFQKDLEVH